LFAKGLDTLAEENPSTDSEESDETPEENAKAPQKAASAEKATPDANATKTAPQEGLSKELADKLHVGTSWGLVKASKSEGNWKSSGMSDLTIAYKLPVEISGMSLWGSFRYAPMAIAGDVDSVAYRGVWEAYNLGAIGKLSLGNGLSAVGSFELGWVLVYLRQLNEVENTKNHESNGFMASLGGGVDWDIVPKFALGPRLYAGFGSATAIQFGAAGTFSF